MPVTHVPVSVPDGTTYTVDADNSGLVHYIPDLTADITITLPTPKAGLWFEFAYAGVAIEVQDWAISTGSDTNFYLGGVLQVDDAPAADSIASNGSSNSILNVLLPEAGTRVRVECHNGTNWVVSGTIVSAGTPTFANQP